MNKRESSKRQYDCRNVRRDLRKSQSISEEMSNVHQKEREKVLVMFSVFVLAIYNFFYASTADHQRGICQVFSDCKASVWMASSYR